MSALKDAYTTKELVSLLGIAFQNIHLRAKRENWMSRPRAGRGGGKVWIFASMPEATRRAVCGMQVEVLFAPLQCCHRCPVYALVVFCRSVANTLRGCFRVRP